MKSSHRPSSVHDDADRALAHQPTASVDDLGATHLRDTTAPADHYPGSAEPPLRTRAGMAWVAVCTATLISVAFLVFIAQNGRSAHVSFLWLDGDTSLAVAALVAAACGALTTLIVGTACITQLRRAVKHRTRAAPAAAPRLRAGRQPDPANSHASPGRMSVARAAEAKSSTRYRPLPTHR